MSEEEVTTLRELGKIGELKTATITGKYEVAGNTIIAIEGIWSFKDYVNKERRTLCSHYTFNTRTKESTKIHSTIQDKDIILYANSTDSQKSAYILQSQTSCLLNILDKEGLSWSLNLKDEDVHGKVYNDEILSSISWSNDSRYLAYIAEKKRLTPVEFLSKAYRTMEGQIGDAHPYYDDWGELLTDFHQSVIVVADTVNQSIRTLELPGSLSPGQITWSLDGNLVGSAFEPHPFRQGLMYCKNRESVLFQMDLENNFAELTPRGHHVRFPRFSPDGEKLVFFSCPSGGQHVKSAQLLLMNWETKQISVLIDYVPKKRILENGDSFFGLCGASVLPLRCWSEGGSQLAFSALDNFGLQTYVVDVGSKEVRRVRSESWVTACDSKFNYIVGATSSFSEAPRIVLIPLTHDGLTSFISSPVEIPGVQCEWQGHWRFLNPNPHPVKSVLDSPVPATYVGPILPTDENKKRPLIVWLHGGPHSIVPNKYYHSIAFFINLGFSILIPNFRGSLGQGKDALESLPGHCGQTDVDDVYQITLNCMKRYEDVLDENKILLYGGSYGGFLVTHLSAQHPDLYKVAVAFNPVTEFSSMATTGDIFDWSFIETGQEYQSGKNLSSDSISRMFAMSPLSRVNDVKAPTLLLLGNSDKRVHMSQGLFYHKMLLTQKVPTKVLLYNDCHTLSKVDSEADWIIQTLLWFNKYS